MAPLYMQQQGRRFTAHRNFVVVLEKNAIVRLCGGFWGFPPPSICLVKYFCWWCGGGEVARRSIGSGVAVVQEVVGGGTEGDNDGEMVVVMVRWY